MKRIVLVIVTFVFVLTGCSSVETNEETASVPTEQTVSVDDSQVSATTGSCKIESIAPLDYESLTEPPSMTVSTLMYVDSVIASSGNYHWLHTLPNGTVGDVIACGAHPLDQQNHPILYTAFPGGTLPPSEDGENVSSIAPIFYLYFGEILPETVSVIRWPASHIGDAQIYSPDFEIVTTELDGDTFCLLPLGDGDCIYEVSADWGDVGGASYTFRTLPQTRETQADKPLETP